MSLSWLSARQSRLFSTKTQNLFKERVEKLRNIGIIAHSKSGWLASLGIGARTRLGSLKRYDEAPMRGIGCDDLG